MEFFQSIVLGVLQGLGEFLPISSSGHLIVVPWLLGWEEHSLTFDVALHLGTLAAVLGAFAQDWIRMFASFIHGLRARRPFHEPDARLLGLLTLASIPGAIVGKLLDDWAETTFRAPLLVASTMTLLGIILLIADRRGGATILSAITLRQALIIGCAQALAILPGVSRSGVTISAALLLSLKREDAARFSFLLATPITCGAALIKVPALLRGGGDLAPLLVGMAAAALVGWLSIFVLLRYVRTHSYRPFVYYRFAFAVLIIAMALLRH
ncbi:MAG: undecaprenyl-diphosphate phosphatase [Vicinamibacteria bacterium]|nr:undecaprenyl-diphosphate phosphatase [Vicinamibacteria bacterium]